MLILTIGHSTRGIEDFIALLRAHGVTKLVDVRTVPKSRHNPQFGRDELPRSLKAAGIAYQHEPALGGLRKTSADSPNKGWRNLSFRGYADHMQTLEFKNATARLIAEAEQGERLVLMCAEAVPWRCHRSLIADALLVRGVRCEDIRTQGSTMPHQLTRFAKVRGTDITYPADDSPPQAAPPADARTSRHARKAPLSSADARPREVGTNRQRRKRPPAIRKLTTARPRREHP